MDGASEASRIPLKPGDVAPAVVLDAINRDGRISTGEWRGRNPVLVGIYRGLQCPFCRRHVALMSQLDPELKAKGIETLTIVNTPAERARLYLRMRPMKNLLASDPTRESHKAFGLPKLDVTPELKATLDATRTDVNGELPEKISPFKADAVLKAKDGYEMTAVDLEMATKGSGQMVGQFLLDREGVVRWTFIEGSGGPETVFKIPTAQQVMSAASAFG